MRICAHARKIGSGAAPAAQRRSADILVCGFWGFSSLPSELPRQSTELENSVNPQAGKPALRGDGSVRFMWFRCKHSGSFRFIGCLETQRQLANHDVENWCEKKAEDGHAEH